VRTSIFAFAFFACLASAAANLGDSGDRIEDSYGEPVQRQLRDDGTVSIVYHKDKYFCLVVFDHYRSVLEKYSRIDRRVLSEKEVARFLKANAAGGKWLPRVATKDGSLERSDHKAEATRTTEDGKPMLIVRMVGAK
jgi:hypothetical protein